jgi:hypothetical protein
VGEKGERDGRKSGRDRERGKRIEEERDTKRLRDQREKTKARRQKLEI